MDFSIFVQLLVLNRSQFNHSSFRPAHFTSTSSPRSWSARLGSMYTVTMATVAMPQHGQAARTSERFPSAVQPGNPDTLSLSVSVVSVSVSLSLGRPLPWRAAATLLWLFMSELRTDQTTSTAHSSAAVRTAAHKAKFSFLQIKYFYNNYSPLNLDQPVAFSVT